MRILDSHTIQAENLCSTMIKTLVVVEKQQTLSQEVDFRIEE